MSEENVEIVRRAFALEVHEGGESAEAEAIFDPNVVMKPVEEEPVHGIDAIRRKEDEYAERAEALEAAGLTE